MWAHLPQTLKVCSAFAITTGSLDAGLGIRMLGKESDFPTASPTTAFADSQFRFLGAMWAGYGVLLWWTSNDLQGRQIPLGLLGGVMLAGGVGRALSALKYGFSAPWVQVAMWVELLGPGVIYLLN